MAGIHTFLWNRHDIYGLTNVNVFRGVILPHPKPVTSKPKLSIEKTSRKLLTQAFLQKYNQAMHAFALLGRYSVPNFKRPSGPRDQSETRSKVRLKWLEGHVALIVRRYYGG